MQLKKLLVIVALTVFACSAIAQGGGGGGRGGQRGGFGGPLTLVRMPEVQTELNLTDDQKTKLNDLNTSYRTDSQQARTDAGTDRAAMQKAMSALTEKYTGEINKILNADQQKRLRELRIQQAAANAVTMKDVQDELGLSDDQKSKIADLQKTQQEANTSLFTKMQNQEIQREELTAGMQKNTKAFSDGVDGILTADQKTKLKAMGGKPFTFPAPRRPGGGGGGL